MFNCSSNLFRFSLAVNGGAAATACGERLRLEMGTAFRTGKEASVGLRTQCSQGLFLEIWVTGSEAKESKASEGLVEK